MSGGRIPKNFIPAIEKGFRNMLAKGPLAGFPVVGLKFDLQGRHVPRRRQLGHGVHAHAPRSCLRETFPKMKPALLEPIMLVEIECPESFQGTVVGNISSRRGIVTSRPT